MAAMLYRLGGIGLACILASSANAQLLARKDLTAAIAIALAETTIATCKANGFQVSVTVVGRNGEILLQVRGDNTGPHTMENSFRKAYTSRTFRIPSGAMEERIKKDPTLSLQYLAGFTSGRGALPIKVGEDVVGRWARQARRAATRTRPASRPRSTKSPTS